MDMDCMSMNTMGAGNEGKGDSNDSQIYGLDIGEKAALFH